ncbi:MAG: TraR/DksA family transcriptional regulator [Oligoflexales bacterium]|nr:TraR/DksA family transcriptional regulator [Oligoflexales bacterium]
MTEDLKKNLASGQAASSFEAVPLAPSDLFSQEELKVFYEMLTKEKKKIVSNVKSALEAGSIRLDANEMMDEVDLASATIEQNLTFHLLDRERLLLAEVEHALDKLKNGGYGYCEGTGESIPKRRLELAPWTRHSVKHKEQLEKMKKSGRGVVDASHEEEG